MLATFLGGKVGTNQLKDSASGNGESKRGDMIVITWGEPMGQVGGTNALNIMKVGEY